ncbi:hypothetical protein DIY18_07735 [Streptococcus iniae]|nr:hypothetical protein DIY18_07735 [Streptococcus iniae]RMI47970.1 hypothetical protein DIY12_10005 [Streptococcus iniae]
MKILLHLIKLIYKKEGIDMMIKLFAINLFYEKTTWTQFLKHKFSELINTKVKEELALMCDEETLKRILEN